MCDEQLQDLEDYIQYQFDDIPSFKLAVFLNNREIKVKTVVGEVEENFISSLISSLHLIHISFDLGDHKFTQCSSSTEKLMVFAAETSSPRIYASVRGENTLIVYCCGTTLEKDDSQIRELMTDLLY